MTAISTVAAPASAETLLERLVMSRGDGVRTGAPWRYGLVTVVVGSLLLTLSAKLSIPFFPVPLSLQTFVVLCLGMVVGPKLAGLTVMAYLLEGAMGLPVFAGTPAKGIGVAYMLGPTGGYLLGFLLAAVATGALARLRWDRNVLLTVAAMVIGNLIIYACGLLWLGTVIGWDKPVLAFGLTPFLLGDALKIALAAAVLPTLWAWVGRSR